MSSQRMTVTAKFRRLKTLPVFPTLFTAGNLACGLTAILCAAHYDRTEHAWMLLVGAVMIFVAMVCDMFDGKIARLTKTAGPFGAELDSLADVVSFGVAPAILMHRLVMGDTGVFAYGERLMWFIAVFYPVMAAIRLARYNVEHSDEATPHFRGIPSPGAAAVVAAWVILHQWVVLYPTEPLPAWVLQNGIIRTDGVWSGLLGLDPFRWAFIAVTIVVSLLMVSTIRYPHVGNSLFGRISFRGMIMVLAVLILLLVLAPWFPVVLFVGTTGYALIGLLVGVVDGWRNWRQGRDLLEDAEEATADDVGDGAGVPRNAAGEPRDVGPAPGR
jgi:CDP-diacylglycerol--serine O-phosphatidyltransferase